jgi:predicted MPP superfamily phosphohydrolase
MLTRRAFLLGGGVAASSMIGIGSYAFAVEPMLRMVVAEYGIAPRGWPDGLDLTIAFLSDIHAIEPWMSAERIAAIAALANSYSPDIVLLGGDYEAGLKRFRRLGRLVPMSECADALATLRAPLGIHAVLGNHDVWTESGDNVRQAFGSRGIPLYENKAVRLEKDGQPFWLLGLGDQMGERGAAGFVPQDDLPGTLRQVTDDAPAILLAHEPDIFPRVPDRVALTLSGHTHGGQISLPLLGAPMLALGHHGKYVQGHYAENGRNLVVTAGLGMSIAPIRFGVPPEIVVLRLGKMAV